MKNIILWFTFFFISKPKMISVHDSLIGTLQRVSKIKVKGVPNLIIK